MYLPQDFRESDPEKIKDFIRENNFATLISWDGTSSDATHLLLELEDGGGGELYLNGHMARANNQWRTFDAGADVLAIFSGAHTYISPRWYDNTNANVPTWNYMAVHASGKSRILTDQAELFRMLERVVDRYESNSGANPLYQLGTLPEEVAFGKMKGVVGFQIKVTKLEAKFKLSQNRSQRDRDNIVAELEKRPDENSLKIAEAMRQARAAKTDK
jgi:transcriptional regulator